MKKHDDLSIRMKTYYESRTKQFLTRRTYTMLRIDGKAFHTYTKGLERPFDSALISDMNDTTKFLCENIQGAKVGYVQSDEISILLTDFDKLTTDAWFDYNVQKMTSVSASYATGYFNQLRPDKLAFFDSRVFQLPTRTEVFNYFLWRQKDCVRNSISSVAQANFSQKELHGKTTNMMQEMLFSEKGINWNDFHSREKRGMFYVKIPIMDLTQEPPTEMKSKWGIGNFDLTSEKDIEEFKNFIPDNQ
jgi:tRNA(His) 5'-end guanylyltransferase